jgi:hypothetical protein
MPHRFGHPAPYAPPLPRPVLTRPTGAGPAGRLPPAASKLGRNAPHHAMRAGGHRVGRARCRLKSQNDEEGSAIRQRLGPRDRRGMDHLPGFTGPSHWRVKFKLATGTAAEPGGFYRFAGPPQVPSLPD